MVSFPLPFAGVTCFDARFGRIEAHEAITAFGRDKLFVAKELAEERGYRVLHGMTDSLWIEGLGLTEAGIKDFLTEIGTKSKVPINLEGIYHWIIFLPSKVHGRPVPNRYFGLFQDGSFKTRGITCCRHDIPVFIKEAQSQSFVFVRPVSGLLFSCQLRSDPKSWMAWQPFNDLTKTLFPDG